MLKIKIFVLALKNCKETSMDKNFMHGDGCMIEVSSTQPQKQLILLPV